MSRAPISSIGGVLLLVAAARAVAAEPPIAYGPPVEQGKLQNPDLAESSGLATSRRNTGVLWTVNDSGHDPTLIAVGTHGEDIGAWRVRGVGRGDWEDLGVASVAGTPVIVIGDIGDNLENRVQRMLHLVPEPRVASTARKLRGEVSAQRTVRYRYPDGARDCEALAVEPDGSRAWLFSKTVLGDASVYVVDLAPAKTTREAERVGTIPVNLVTAASMSADGRLVAVGTYTAAYLFRRGADESWAAALQRAPERHLLPPRAQGEGLAIAADGRSLFASSEGLRSPLWLVPAADRQ